MKIDFIRYLIFIRHSISLISIQFFLSSLSLLVFSIQMVHKMACSDDLLPSNELDSLRSYRHNAFLSVSFEEEKDLSFVHSPFECGFMIIFRLIPYFFQHQVNTTFVFSFTCPFTIQVVFPYPIFTITDWCISHTKQILIGMES